MSLATDILEVLAAATEPLTNKGIREHLDDDVTTNAVGTALVALLKKGAIERVDIEGQHHCGYVIATAPPTKAGKPAPAPKITADPAPAPVAETASETVSTVEEAPARVIDRAPPAVGDFARRLMREAAMLLLDAAGEAPMSPRAARVIAQLIEASA